MTAKRGYPSSSPHHAAEQPSGKRPRLETHPEPQSEGALWTALGNIWGRLMGRRKPGRPSPQVRRANGTATVGLQLGLEKSRCVPFTPNGHTSGETVVEVSDDDGEGSIDHERLDKQKIQARGLLNDHNRHAHREEQAVNEPASPQLLFSSVFNPTPSPAATERRPSPSPADATSPNRPNVGFNKPRRDYSFARSRSSSANLSISSSSSSPPRSPRKATRTSLRNVHGEERQMTMLNRLIARDPQTSAPLVRVREEMLRTKQPARHHSMRPVDLSQIFPDLKLDTRKTLDDALEQHQGDFQPPRPHKARDRLRPAPFQQVKSGVLERFRTEKEEEEKRIAARLQPRIPKDVTPEQNEIVRQRLADPMFKSEAVDAKALRTLKPGVWLNDEIINFYVDALRARAEKEGRNIAVGNSFFYQKLNEQGYSGVKRWGRTRKIPQKDLFVIPVHVQGCHWTCACINFTEKRIEYYDSLSDNGFRKNVFRNLRMYLEEEWRTRLQKDFDFTGWRDVYNNNTPQQSNGSDCGVFACQTMEALARGRDLTKGRFEFDSSNMPFFRKLMIVEIASGELADRVWS